MLTGSFDRASIRNSCELGRQCKELGAGYASVKVCHIMGRSTQRDIHATGERGADAMTNEVRHSVQIPRYPYSSTPVIQTYISAAPLSVLTAPRLDDLIKSLAIRDGIHSLGNLLSLNVNCRDWFDNLELWFERTTDVRLPQAFEKS